MGRRTRSIDEAVRIVTGVFAWGLAASLPALLISLFVRAAPAASDALVSAALASISLVAAGLVLATPMALLAAIWLEDERQPARLRELAELNLAALGSLPSLAFALPAVMLAAALPTLAALVLVLVLALLTPLVTSCRAALVEVSESEREAGLALGGTRGRVIWHVVLPTAGRGLIGGGLSAFARGLGYTAPLVVLLAMLDVRGAGASAGLSVSLFESLVVGGREPWSSGTAAAAALLLALVGVGLDGVGLHLRASEETRRGGPR